MTDSLEQDLIAEAQKLRELIVELKAEIECLKEDLTYEKGPSESDAASLRELRGKPE